MSHDYEKDANATSRYAEDLEIIDEYIDTHQQANPFSLHYTKQLVQSLQDCHKELEALKEKAMERDALAKRVEELELFLTKLHPYMDSIICYASTVNEHEGNMLNKEMEEFLK